MHIECILHRDGGSKITLGDIIYHFAPQPDGAQVSLVENTNHQDRFLSISEGYRVYRGEHKPAASAVAAEVKPAAASTADDEGSDVVALYGSSQHDARYTIHGKDFALGDIVALAQTASGLSSTDWNSLSEDGRADLIDAELDKLNEAGPAGNADAEHADLVTKYKEKFGKKPHYRWTAEKISEELAK